MENGLESDSERTLRPHAPKSCSEFATISMPSQSMLSMSSSLYSSITVGRKKTRRPPGFKRYLARTTRSAARAESSYGLVGGMYGWSALLRGRLSRSEIKCRCWSTHAPCCDGIDESVVRPRFRPRRFAPARTPSGASHQAHMMLTL